MKRAHPVPPTDFAVPAVTLVNYWLEHAFAERWFGRVTHRENVPRAASLTGEMPA